MEGERERDEGVEVEDRKRWREGEVERRGSGGWRGGGVSLQTQVATLFFSRGNSLKLKLNLKLMKHILAVAFVSEVINYLYQPRRQRFLSVN